MALHWSLQDTARETYSKHDHMSSSRRTDAPTRRSAYKLRGGSCGRRPHERADALARVTRVIGGGASHRRLHTITCQYRYGFAGTSIMSVDRARRPSKVRSQPARYSRWTTIHHTGWDD